MTRRPEVGQGAVKLTETPDPTRTCGAGIAVPTFLDRRVWILVASQSGHELVLESPRCDLTIPKKVIRN